MSPMASPKGTGPCPFVAVQPHDARAACGQQILAGTLHPGALLAITADRGIDDARIDSPDRLIVQPQPFDDARPEVLDARRRPAREAASVRQDRPRSEVYRKASLARLIAWKMGRVAADFRVAQIKPAGKIAAIWPLDLDHPRPEIHQPQRTIGAGKKTGSCRRPPGRKAAVRILFVMRGYSSLMQRNAMRMTVGQK